MGTRYERSQSDNEQVVWLSPNALADEEVPGSPHREFQNPLSRLYGRTAEAAPA